MDQPLSTTQLERIMKKCLPPNVFKGVFSSDHLPRTDHFTLPWCLIANTDCSHRRGSHWIGMYFDVNADGHYFDSFGHHPTKKEWIQFLQENSRTGHWVMQRRKIQREFSSFCGYYTVYFLFKRHTCPLSESDYEIMLDVNDNNICQKLQSVWLQIIRT